MSSCKHRTLLFTPSRHAQDAGYTRPSSEQLAQATSVHAASKKQKPDPSALPAQEYNPSTFPAPLVLPGDELSFDPHYDPQPASECIHNPGRNRVTDNVKTVYVVPVPRIDDQMNLVNKWAEPQTGERAVPIPKPKTADVLAYLQAFYHGLPVKLLETPRLSFVPWEPASQRKSSRSRIGLAIGKQVIGIRHRASKDKLYSGQLNLNDLLDAAISILPRDAYALLMLTDHDLYEDEADDFCCGRAYGGSRVAVVSWARYNPLLDRAQEIETEHAWPASHCAEYVEDVCVAFDPAVPKSMKKNKSAVRSRKAKSKTPNPAPQSAMHSATAAFNSLPTPKTREELSNLWLGRFCKTASHELGHCVGMDHCVYYACVMQGTSGLTEDAAQPPYLCPVDLVKTLNSTGVTEAEHCNAMLEFCMQFPTDRMFRAFEEWLKVRLGEIVQPA